MDAKIKAFLDGLNADQRDDVFRLILPEVSADHIWADLDDHKRRRIADEAINDGFAFDECSEDHDPEPEEISPPSKFSDVCSTVIASRVPFAVNDLEAVCCELGSNWKRVFDDALDMHRASLRRAA